MRAAAIDRALGGDDPEPALAIAGAADIAADGGRADPFTAAMLAVTVAAIDDDRPFDERAWTPGTSAAPLAVAGAAAAVRLRDISLDRAAALADCAPAAVEKQRCREKPI